MIIRPLFPTEKTPYDLLFLADPSLEMIEKYILKSSIYVAALEDQIIGVNWVIKLINLKKTLQPFMLFGCLFYFKNRTNFKVKSKKL
jgi:hypothetical protein